MLPAEGGLIAANHVSWIDIFAVNALTPVAFVSKDDVIHWPIIGTLARHNETIFLQRGSRGHAHTIGRDIAPDLMWDTSLWRVEHSRCNRAAGARYRNAKHNRRVMRTTSRDW